jgi:hypothetical protein
MIAGEEGLLRKHAEFIAKAPASFGEHYSRLGLFYVAVGDVRRAREALGKALGLRPTPSTLARYFLTLGGGRLYSFARALRELFRGVEAKARDGMR